MDMSPNLNFIISRITAILSLLIVLFFPHASMAQVNKCEINGKIVYTDKACPDNTAEKLDLSKTSFSTTTLFAPSSARKSFSTNSTSRLSKSSSPGWLQDQSGYKKALKLSASKGVPIFIYGYTDWCVYCKKLHKGLFQDSSVKKVLSRFIKVKLNPEHSRADEKLFKQWGGSGYPTLYIQARANSSPARTRGPFTKKNGKWKLMSKAEFIAMLEAGL